MNPHGDAPVRSGAIDEDMSPKVPDPNIADRTVSTKPANQPFIAYKEYRNKRRLNIKLGKNV